MKKSFIIRGLSFSALALLSVSCITKDGGSDPYSNSNPYYGPQGAYGDNTAAAPVADSSGYVAPAPAENSYSAPPSPYQAPASNNYSAPSNSGGGSKSHTVVRGDTLYSLARRYGTSVNTIKNTNGLNSNLIRLGQNLRIP
ncbi:MAG: LysM peptidoglycan-binding domain-containing protein [Verrucomicrobiales bacterium]|nr:LysM peptidoglycan-binding domain-containing protein [Verrucomicrobiales bacterium]